MKFEYFGYRFPVKLVDTCLLKSTNGIEDKITEYNNTILKEYQDRIKKLDDKDFIYRYNKGLELIELGFDKAEYSNTVEEYQDLLDYKKSIDKYIKHISNGDSVIDYNFLNLNKLKILDIEHFTGEVDTFILDNMVNNIENKRLKFYKIDELITLKNNNDKNIKNLYNKLKILLVDKLFEQTVIYKYFTSILISKYSKYNYLLDNDFISIQSKFFNGYYINKIEVYPYIDENVYSNKLKENEPKVVRINLNNIKNKFR